MTTFVIVHGGFGGGWEWTPVARLLRDLGHEVYTPTLTGMGERSHLASTQVVGLATHVQDIVGVLEFEDLRDVVLVGASYGGVPVTCAADRVAHRVSLVVYVDALVPADGESALDLLPASFCEDVMAGFDSDGERFCMPMPDGLQPIVGWPSDEDRASYLARLRPQPAMTFFESVYLTGAVNHLPRAFVRCTRSTLGDVYDEDPIAEMALRAEKGLWHYRELAASHDPQLSNPEGTVGVLAELATSVLGVLEPVRPVPRQQHRAAMDSTRSRA